MRCFGCAGGGSSSPPPQPPPSNNREQSKKRNRKMKNKLDEHALDCLDTKRKAPDKSPMDTGKAVSESVSQRLSSSTARSFSLAELAAATHDFSRDLLLGEGGFGKVYKGRLHDTNEIVAIKKLDRSGSQGIREFLVEVITLGAAKHENLVKLIGYCAEGDQRLLVYEYMPLGSLENHLYDTLSKRKRLDWNTRMNIAAGAARGLEYLHETMKPPIIYRDLKCSNILLGPGYHVKLSDFGLAKVGPTGDRTHVSTRVMGTYGYCAPEYAMTGQLTFKSDIYSFGVVLLELLSGRPAIDDRRPGPEQNLVAWAKPLFKDRKNFVPMADKALEGRYPRKGLHQSLAIAAMCVSEQPNLRPKIGDIVSALNYLAAQTYDPSNVQSPRKTSSSRNKKDSEQKHASADGTETYMLQEQQCAPTNGNETTSEEQKRVLVDGDETTILEKQRHAPAGDP